MNTNVITKTVFFNAAPTIVWAFLTEKEKLREWYHHCDKNWAEGEHYELYSLNKAGEKKVLVWGNILEAKSPASLVYSFHCGALGDITTTVRCTLEESSGGTRLTLSHEGIDLAVEANTLSMLTALDKGWDDHLARLREQASQ